MWDIYGNPLKRGHCEVHPQVAEEYPCSLCMAESDRKRMQDQQHQQYWKQEEDAYNRTVAIEEHQMEFEKYPALVEHIQRMASTGQTGNTTDWSEFLTTLNVILKSRI